MSKMRFKYRVWLAIIVIIAALLFAWWASGEIYNPRPTKIPTATLPTKVGAETATMTPTMELTPTQTAITVSTATIAPTATSTTQPTLTASETEHSATVTATPTETLAPTVTHIVTPTATSTHQVELRLERSTPLCEMLVYKHNHAIYYPYCWEWLR